MEACYFFFSYSPIKQLSTPKLNFNRCSFSTLYIACYLAVLFIVLLVYFLRYRTYIPFGIQVFTFLNMEQRVYSEDNLKYIHLSTNERQLEAVHQSNLDWADIVVEDDNVDREISSNDSPASSTKSVKDYTTNANFDRSTPRLFQAMLSSTIPNRGSASKLNVLAQEFSSMSVMDSPSEE